MTTVLITGSSGFIGFHVSERFLKSGMRVVGVDNLSDYYDVGLKLSRQNILKEYPQFKIYNEDIQSAGLLRNIFDEYRPEIVIHCAAQAGVRYSIDNPRAYLETNISGTFELLEAARLFPPRHMLLASTSSAYGANEVMPYLETHKSDHQMSFYAATKKATEVMAHSYSHIYSIPITMFRFFTVYGPWGRPDMALFKFVKSIKNGDSIDVYNNGNMKRDFTYIDDLVESVIKLSSAIPSMDTDAGTDDSRSPVAPWRIVNVGNSTPVGLIDFINEIEECLGCTAIKNYLPMQAGDVPATWANTELLRKLTGSNPASSVKHGVKKFIDWYDSYYDADITN